MARKIARTFELDDVTVEIFNNGELRRQLSTENTSSADFFSPTNRQGVELRETYSRINLERARTFLDNDGKVAIIDASNVTKQRRAMISAMFPGLSVLFIECINIDEEVREANLERKLSLKEFGHLSPDEALDSFLKRISHYEGIYEPLQEERNRIVVDSFAGRILQEQIADLVPYYDRIRDLLTTRTVKNLFLVRHGETHYNLEDRIGGDSELTEKGARQAQSLADYFSTWRIPIIFRSNFKRTLQTAT
ncbi:MAG: 6-phosphofructo-2-kinase domain-containing protein, partial [Desulfobulbaceae bacterium]|nr:6-phosphofructo-2-kinase domain-containing protein [Desulfobulbaceae bacterium]